MKNLKLFSIMLFFAIFIYSCDEDSPVITPESEVSSFSSNEWGNLNTSSGAGISIIPGTVPFNDKGENASVSFSIETEVESPKQLRSGAKFKSGLVKFGPENFSFRWPIRLALPYGELDPNDLYVMYYNQIEEKWDILPKSGLNIEEKVIYFNSLNLGVFGLAQITSDYRFDDWSDGGFKYFGSNPNYSYALTVATATNFKYPWQEGAWNPIGKNASTGTNSTAIHFTLPQADYQLWVTRQKHGTSSSLPGPLETYSIPLSGTLDEPVHCTLSSGDLDFDCSPWVELSLPTGGHWVEGSPELWPVPTKTYGTGDFCATLNWTNNDYHSTDVDLHLYGPDGLHIYWDNQKSPDESLELDRDWLTEYGYAIENIYSLKEMPSGKYQVKVKLYGGDATNYSVRVIRNGTPKTKTGRLTTEKEEVLITEFTK